MEVIPIISLVKGKFVVLFEDILPLISRELKDADPMDSLFSQFLLICSWMRMTSDPLCSTFSTHLFLDEDDLRSPFVLPVSTHQFMDEDDLRSPLFYQFLLISSWMRMTSDIPCSTCFYSSVPGWGWPPIPFVLPVSTHLFLDEDDLRSPFVLPVSTHQFLDEDDLRYPLFYPFLLICFWMRMTSYPPLFYLFLLISS